MAKELLQDRNIPSATQTVKLCFGYFATTTPLFKANGLVTMMVIITIPIILKLTTTTAIVNSRRKCPSISTSFQKSENFEKIPCMFRHDGGIMVSTQNYATIPIPCTLSTLGHVSQLSFLLPLLLLLFVLHQDF